jgi:hypothetical protein
MADCPYATIRAQRHAGRNELLTDAARLFRQVFEGDAAFSWGDVSDWLKAYDALEHQERKRS